MSFSGIGLTGVARGMCAIRGTRICDAVSGALELVRGRHSVKAGFTLYRVWYADGQANGNLFGSLSFSNRFTGHPYGDFLPGIPTTSSPAFFLTDEFKASRKLMLTLGARYEYNPCWRETNGRMSMFDLASGKIVVPDASAAKISPLMPRGYVDVIEAAEAGLPGDRMLRTDRNNFAPRIGVAYRPWGTRTVFRMGYGIFYDVVPETLSFGGTPFILNEPSFTNPTPNPVVVLPWVFPQPGGSRPSTVSVTRAVRRDRRCPTRVPSPRRCPPCRSPNNPACATRPTG